MYLTVHKVSETKDDVAKHESSENALGLNLKFRTKEAKKIIKTKL